MNTEFLIENQQTSVSIPDPWLQALTALSQQALSQVLREKIPQHDVLSSLEIVETTFVDDATSDRVHRDFMNISGATDVITFHHGEIVISAEVAVRQAQEFGEPLSRELLRYFIHGLLHLAGHQDTDPADRKHMEATQEKIVTALWNTNFQEACRSTK